LHPVPAEPLPGAGRMVRKAPQSCKWSRHTTSSVAARRVVLKQPRGPGEYKRRVPTTDITSKTQKGGPGGGVPLVAFACVRDILARGCDANVGRAGGDTQRRGRPPGSELRTGPPSRPPEKSSLGLLQSRPDPIRSLPLVGTNPSTLL